MPIWPQFVDGYLEAALWTAADEDGDPLDEHYSIENFSQKAVNEAVSDCNKFIEKNREDLEAVGDEGRNGHDFWLTRGRHGAGFWDRGYGEVGKRLTDAAHKFPERHVYTGSDDLLYFE